MGDGKVRVLNIPPRRNCKVYDHRLRSVCKKRMWKRVCDCDAPKKDRVL